MKNRIKELIQSDEFILPSCFILPFTVKCILFSMGIYYSDNIVGRYTPYPVYAIFFILTFFYVVKKIKVTEDRKVYVYGAVIAVVFGLLVAYGVISSNFSGWIVNYGSQYILYCIPALFLGIVVSTKNLELTLMDGINKLNILVAPAALGYFILAVTNSSPFANGTYLGMMDYMSFSYGIMAFFCVSFIRVFEYDYRVREERCKGIFYIILSIIYWVDIIVSGTRGTLVCCLVFFGLYIIFSLIKKTDPLLVIFYVIVLVGIYIAIYNSEVEGFQAVKRMSMVVSGLKEGQIVTSETVDHSRGVLYTDALRELKNNMIFGIKPFGYTVKYGLYPHNIILELLCETGIIFGGAVCGGLLYCVYRVLAATRFKDQKYKFICILIAFNCQYLFSCSFWKASLMFMGVGYALGLKKEHKKIESK